MLKQEIIVIDKGHTKIGKDPGAVSKKGQQEGKTNANVGDEVIRILREEGYKVSDTNPSGQDMTINQRVYAAKLVRPSICVSIHHNAGGGKGAEVFAEFNDNDSVVLASLVLNELKPFNTSRGVKTERSTVNPNKNKLGMLNVPNCTNVLIEAAFMDSNDIEKIDTLKEQQYEAKLIAKAIVKFIKRVK